MTAKWHFRKKQSGEITRDLVVGEFFSTDAIAVLRCSNCVDSQELNMGCQGV